MDNIIKEIDAIYDSFLAKFRFFRRFLTLLRHLSFEVKNHQNRLDWQTNQANIEFSERLNELELQQEAMHKVLGELIETVENLTPKHAEPRPAKTASQILDKYYAVYNAPDADQ
jgi:hypothetical protein